MKKLIFLVSLWAAMAGTTSANGVHLLEEALELSASQVRFSLTGAGSITVRTCRDCVPKSYPLSGDTEFLFNGERMTRERFAELSRQGGQVYVFYDTQSGDVTRMRLINRTSRANRAQR